MGQPVFDYEEDDVPVDNTSSNSPVVPREPDLDAGHTGDRVCCLAFVIVSIALALVFAGATTWF
jgi:hypothetical protein